MTEQLQCERHGQQNEAYVCAHIVRSLADKKPRGLIWSRDDEGSINAYCYACDDMLRASNGEWTEEMQERAGIATACETCIKPIFALNGITEPE